MTAVPVKRSVKPLENNLNRISKLFISIEKEEKVFAQHFVNVSTYVVECMKHNDELFKKIFQMLQLAGSYADGIKVTAPNEFDVLVLLKFPKPVPVGSRPGYVTINIKDGLNTFWGWMTNSEDKYKRFVDSMGFLIQDQILGWLRELVRGILREHKNIFKINGVEYSIEQRNSGPAVTLDVDVLKSPNGSTSYFSIDFVAALQFQTSNVWVADANPIIQVPRYWNAIPKPNKLLLHNNREWICSYAEIERDYLNGLNRIKPLIKIFKKIRDKFTLTNLKSYYIKTIFLHHRLKVDPNYWNGSLAILFMEMFDIILEHLRTRTLWSLWHKDYNLFDQLGKLQTDAIYNNLKKIKENIVRNLHNPEYIYQVILTSSEMMEMMEMERMEKIEDSQWSCIIL